MIFMKESRTKTNCLMKTIDKSFNKGTGLFIAPIIVWVANYGFLLIMGSAVTELWIESLLMGVAPYLFLWSIFSRLPDKAKLCTVGSLIIFFLTVLTCIIKYFQCRNAEEAIKMFLVPIFQVVVIWCLGLITLIGTTAMYIKRNSLSRK